MKFNKRISLLSLCLVATGAIAPIVATSISKHENKLPSEPGDVSLLGPYIHKEPNARTDIISSTQLSDHENAVADKLQLALSAAGCDYDTMVSTVGTFKANVLAHKTQSLSAHKGDEDNLANKDAYNYINEQAAIFGLDVPDYSMMYNSIIPNVASSKPEVVQRVQNIIEQAQYGLLSTNELQINIVRALGSNDASAVTQTVLQQAVSSLNRTLTIANDGSFINKLAAYSANGQYKVGDVLSQDDIATLFNLQYSNVEGYDYADNYSELEDIEPSFTGEYDQSVIDSLTTTRPMSAYNCAYATWNDGEFLPGYLLKAKITSLDAITDSSKCNITFQLGIQNAANPDDIIWSDINNGDTSNGVITTSIDVNNFANKVYCANHTYDYASRTSNIDITNLDKTINAKGDIYLSKTKDSRTLIENILTKYVGPEGQDYDLKNYPIVTTDENDWKGLPQAQVQGIEDMIHDRLHANQRLALVVSDLDDNNSSLDSYSLCLKMGWAIVDIDPATNTLKPVYNINFIDTDAMGNVDIPQDPTITNSVWVAFDMNEGDKDVIEQASNIELLALNATASKNLFTTSNQFTDESFERRQNYIDKALDLNIAAIAAATACDIAAAAVCAMLSMSTMLAPDAILLTTMGADCTALSGYNMAEIIKIKADLKASHYCKTRTLSYQNNQSFNDKLNQILSYVDTVFDKKAQLTPKLEACRTVNALWENDLEFRKAMADITSSACAWGYADDNSSNASDNQILDWINKVVNDKQLRNDLIVNATLSTFGFVTSMFSYAIISGVYEEVYDAMTSCFYYFDEMVGEDVYEATIIDGTWYDGQMIEKLFPKFYDKFDLLGTLKRVDSFSTVAAVASVVGTIFALISIALNAAANVYIADAK